MASARSSPIPDLAAQSRRPGRARYGRLLHHPGPIGPEPTHRARSRSSVARRGQFLHRSRPRPRRHLPSHRVHRPSRHKPRSLYDSMLAASTDKSRLYGICRISENHEDFRGTRARSPGIERGREEKRSSERRCMIVHQARPGHGRDSARAQLRLTPGTPPPPTSPRPTNAGTHEARHLSPRKGPPAATFVLKPQLAPPTQRVGGWTEEPGEAKRPPPPKQPPDPTDHHLPATLSRSSNRSRQPS